MVKQVRKATVKPSKIKSLNLWRVKAAGGLIPEQELWAVPIILHTGTNPVLQLFPGAAVTTVGRSVNLVASATGGVLQRAVQVTPGPGTCTTLTAAWTGITALRASGFLCVVSGSSHLFDVSRR